MVIASRFSRCFLKSARIAASAPGLFSRNSDSSVAVFIVRPQVVVGLRRARGDSNLEYAPRCELMGRSPIAPAAFNCQAPDTGNMEILAEYGTDEQKSRWLGPMLAGSMRSCYAMTEPDTAGSDPTGLATRAVRDGDQWVINGHKWFTTGAIGAAFAIVMTVSD